MTVALRESLAPSRASAAIQDAVRQAAAQALALRPVGSGGWLDAGRPVASTARHLSLLDDAGIVDYVPGDLTLTARGGTTLAAIARAATSEGQWLALDPFGSDEGTLGATIATASAGPLAQLFGGPRDNVLGIEFVTGAGTVARGGGRVVKNVAGFDLVRLVTGSWGTLGIVTEATVRLRSVPERDETIAIRMPDEASALAERVERARVAPAAPWALELVNAAAADRLGLPKATSLLVRLGGNAAVVDAQRTTFGALGAASAVAGGVWSRLRGAEPAEAVVFRLSGSPARLADSWQAAVRCTATLPGTLLHATVGRGVVRCIIPLEAIARAGAQVHLPSIEAHPLVRALGVTPPAPGRIFERLPPAFWPVLAPGGANDRLSRGIRDAFDPHRLLNPGILGESTS